MDQKDSTQINLTAGLDLMGKVYLKAPQWAGKFAQKQKDHTPDMGKAKTFFGRSILGQFNHYGWSVKQCNLCMLEKHRSEFVHLCRCSHEYCYSCLNSYAISRIQDMSVVVCPQQDCGQIMHIASKVYRFLPDKQKIKYLQNKNVFKFNKEDQQNRCQRCFEQKHEGVCKYSLQPKVLDNTFKFRECPRCKTEVYMTQGKKRVVCKNCHHAMCYLCGNQWREIDSKQKHVCGMKGTIQELQKQFSESKCCNCAQCCVGCECDCDYCGCNQDIDCHCDCQLECCRNCDSDCLCEIMFFCDSPSLFCILINLLSIPIRLTLTAIILAVMAMFMIPISFVLVFWIAIGFVGGFTVVTCELISKSDCPLTFFMILFYPITALIATGYAMYETRQLPESVFIGFFGSYCEMLGGIWINCSPKECLS